MAGFGWFSLKVAGSRREREEGRRVLFFGLGLACLAGLEGREKPDLGPIRLTVAVLLFDASEGEKKRGIF